MQMLKYRETKPCAALAGYVKCFWILEKDYAQPDQTLETIFPDGCLDLIFHSGCPLAVVSEEGFVQQPSAFIIGQMKQPLMLTSSGYTRVIGVRFFPFGAFPFLQTSLKALADQTVALDLLVGGVAAELGDRIQELPTRPALGLIEQFLCTRLASTPIQIGDIAETTRLLYQQHGLITIPQLADYANMTRRSLERKFADIVGYSPKTLARILRFNRVRNDLMLDATLNLTDLAYRYGYFDQAHFIHDFQQFSQQTPSAFVEKVLRREFYFYK